MVEVLLMKLKIAKKNTSRDKSDLQLNKESKDIIKE